jgi:hypothetical protein
MGCNCGEDWSVVEEFEMKSLGFSSWIQIWSLAGFLQGLWLFDLLLPDYMPGFRVPFLCGLVTVVHLPVIHRQTQRDIRSVAMIALISVIVLVFVLSLLVTGRGGYGLWKLGVFSCMSFVPVILLCRCYMGRGDLVMHLLRAIMFLSIISVLQLVKIISEFGPEMIKWQLINKGIDVIGMSRGFGVGAVLAAGLLCRCQSTWRKALALGVVLLMVIGQALIEERGPLLASLCCVIYLIFGKLRQDLYRRNSKQLLVYFIIIASLVLVVCQFPTLLERFTMREVSDDGRFDVLQKGIKDINQMNLLFGMGLGNFSYESGVGGNVREFAHNIFAEIFLEAGLMGITAFIAFGYAVYIFVFSRKAKTCAPEATLVSDAKALFIYAVLNAQVSGDLGTNYMVWVAGCLSVCAVVASSSNSHGPVACNYYPGH